MISQPKMNGIRLIPNRSPTVIEVIPVGRGILFLLNVHIILKGGAAPAHQHESRIACGCQRVFKNRSRKAQETIRSLMGNIPKRFYEFGQFRIDPLERLLWKEEELVPLPPKVFAILLTLVENAPRIVEKNELLKTVWPDTFVEESNLSQNVFSLRKVLGEPECIENVPKRGYRFIAPLHKPEAMLSDRPAARQKLRRAGLAAGAAALLILTGTRALNSSFTDYLTSF